VKLESTDRPASNMKGGAPDGSKSWGLNRRTHPPESTAFGGLDSSRSGPVRQFQNRPKSTAFGGVLVDCALPYIRPLQGAQIEGARAPSVCVRPLWGPDQAMLLHSPPQEGVLRRWSGTTLDAHPRGRHTSPPLGGALRGNSRPTPPPGSGRGSYHPSQGGFPHTLVRSATVGPGDCIWSCASGPGPTSQALASLRGHCDASKRMARRSLIESASICVVPAPTLRQSAALRAESFSQQRLVWGLWVLPQSSRVCSATQRAPRPLRQLAVGVAAAPVTRIREEWSGSTCWCF